jgi:pilus assembly protein CpaC
MKNRNLMKKISLAVLLAGFLLPVNAHAKKTRLVAVNADVVEISGTMQTVKGFSWNQLFDFEEASIPGILSLGEFERKTAVTTRLRLMETEGRAQILSNPKIVTASGNNAKITVGGKVPIPVVNNQGVGSQMEEYGILLNVLPTIIPERNNIIDLSVQLVVSSVDYSRTVVIGTSAAPSFINREVETHVELNSGETLVIGGLKSSSRNVAEDRVPFLGRIPLIGLLFKNKDVTEEQRSLFLFITVEIVE